MTQVSKHAVMVDIPPTIGSLSIIGILSNAALKHDSDDMLRFFKDHSECVFLFRLPTYGKDARFFQILGENLKALDDFLLREHLPLEWIVV